MLLLHLSDVDEASWAEQFRSALAPYRVVRRGDCLTPCQNFVSSGSLRYMPIGFGSDIFAAIQ